MKLIIFGGGDLAQRVLALLPLTPAIQKVVLVTRDATRGEPFARLFNGYLPATVRHVELDLNQISGISEVLRKERPDIIFHAASMLSPWLLSDTSSPLSKALRSAGFGLMLSAQLPLIRHVMRAVMDTGLDCPVVNASYPDVTHPVLAAEGLQPTLGIGNAGMLYDTLCGELRSKGVGDTPRLLAHHAQVTPFSCHSDYAPGEEPWLFLEDRPVSLANFVRGPLPNGRALNILTAAHAVKIIGSLLGKGSPLHTSAPGPLGLPGGWPVRVSAEGVVLDLPKGVDIKEGLAYQTRAAVGDGLAAIDTDGTVHYTSAAQACLASYAPQLAEPLSGHNETRRLAELTRLLTA